MNIKSILCAIAFLTALALAYGLVGATETNLTKTDWEQQAKQNWTARHGDMPKEPTAEELQYMQNYTALLQAEKNKERENDRAATTGF